MFDGNGINIAWPPDANGRDLANSWQPEHKVFADGRQPTILYQTHLCRRKAPNDSPPLNQPGFFGPSLPTPRWGVLALVSAGP